MIRWPDNMPPPADEDDCYDDDTPGPVGSWDLPEPPWKDEE